MKSHLLLFLSTILLLFALPKSSTLYGISSAEQGQLVKKRCAAGVLKRPCARKCLKHQTHSEQRGAGTVVTDCSQPYYAIVDTPEAAPLFSGAGSHEISLPAPRRYLAPDLAHEPDPPRFS